MRVVKSLKGPYKDEAEFRAALTRRMERQWRRVFHIETEETEKGFPDLLCCSPGTSPKFTEVKYIREDGKIHFQPTQPLWYKKHLYLDVQILAWDSRFNHMVIVAPEEVVRAKTLSLHAPDTDEEYEGEEPEPLAYINNGEKPTLRETQGPINFAEQGEENGSAN